MPKFFVTASIPGIHAATAEAAVKQMRNKFKVYGPHEEVHLEAAIADDDDDEVVLSEELIGYLNADVKGSAIITLACENAEELVADLFAVTSHLQDSLDGAIQNGHERMARELQEAIRKYGNLCLMNFVGEPIDPQDFPIEVTDLMIEENERKERERGN